MKWLDRLSREDRVRVCLRQPLKVNSLAMFPGGPVHHFYAGPSYDSQCEVSSIPPGYSVRNGTLRVLEISGLFARVNFYDKPRRGDGWWMVETQVRRRETVELLFCVVFVTAWILITNKVGGAQRRSDRQQ